MASNEALAKAFVLLRRAYPDHVQRYLGNGQTMTETMDLYLRLCEVLLVAAQDHIARSKWWPNRPGRGHLYRTLPDSPLIR